MNRILQISFLLCLSVISRTVAAQSSEGIHLPDMIFAPSEGIVSKIEKPLRKEICLNGSWDFQAVAVPADYKQGSGITPALPAATDKWDAVKIKIPSPWNINSFANRNLEGPDHRNYPSYPAAWDDVKMAWMRRTVDIPADWQNSRIKIHFEAVAGQTQVLVNGQKVADNFDLFLPFDADITDFVKAGEQAEILVGVRSQQLFEDNSTKGRRIVPAGSMWGYHINGIWQDVYLLAVSDIHISDVFVKPLVSQGVLELDITIDNTTSKAANITLDGSINQWINKAGKDVRSAPVPDWELGRAEPLKPAAKTCIIEPGSSHISVYITVPDGALEYWTPEHPNLYGLTLALNKKSTLTDLKFVRFGWREWTFDGARQLLNGKPYQLRGDSWHFMGAPQLTRRYAYAWFTALKDANANAVRPHAQIYPRFYFDVADEMGICILAETANWASDGGPKMDAPTFWENSKDHLRRMVIRDRNHPSVFGWSISNENKPVIINVFNKPEWMTFQKQAWQDWCNIVRENDPTRPWISADGEDDGDGILPTTVGHYGDESSLKHWADNGKPWGVGETSMAYYGTPEQVAKFNGQRAYESMLGRMEGLAYECYRLISQQRNAGASYSSVFNIAWYALQPLPLGKRDLSTPPSLDEGIRFGDYRENQPGIQPERLGPYCSTFNPGYDPSLPLYRTWPMFDAIRAANAPDTPAWSPWSVMPETSPAPTDEVATTYSAVLFIGKDEVKKAFENQRVVFTAKLKQTTKALLIIDGKYSPSAQEITEIKTSLSKGVDIWLWSPTAENIDVYNSILPANVGLVKRPANSYLPENKSWFKNTVNSDFYFSEIQTEDASQYALTGAFVDEGEILLRACRTNWRRWNKRAEELKTASVLRSEYETPAADAVFVRFPQGASTVYISTIDNFTSSEKGYNTLSKILRQAGVNTSNAAASSEQLIDDDGYVQLSKLLYDNRDGRRYYLLNVFSPRPLDDLLIEPDMPKLNITAPNRTEIRLNGRRLESLSALPLKQGWNNFAIFTDAKAQIRFVCDNHPEFIRLLQTQLTQ